MKVHELLHSKNRWTKGTNARDSSGNPVSPCDERACKWCLLGAMYRCYPKSVEYNDVFIKTMRELPEYRHIGTWNDRHSYEEVIELAKKLDI